MYSRIIAIPPKKSFFLFGPRGTGKTTWLKNTFRDAVYIDLLDAEFYNHLLANPRKLEQHIPPDFGDWVIIDEIQRVPELLYEIHRLIEERKTTFILTGSSARKLKKKNVNLLAGRALTQHLFPLTAKELENDFKLENSLAFGHLPAIFSEPDKKRYLESYVATYLREEIQQEGLTRNLAAFSRFLEAASFSHGQVLNLSEIARECAVHRKVAESYFSILEDILIADHLPVFTKKAKRRMFARPKFYFFDVGIYRALRPCGPLDAPEEIEGAALEGLIFQELKAINSYLNLDYRLYYWRTAAGAEVDFILYGKKDIKAIEVKRSSKINRHDLRGLKLFLEDYPAAKAYMVYGGQRRLRENGIEIIPAEQFLRQLPEII